MIVESDDVGQKHNADASKVSAEQAAAERERLSLSFQNGVAEADKDCEGYDS